jgi:hypothetical protein
VVKPLSEALAQFKNHLDMGLGSLYKANLLVNLQPTDASKVVEEMLTEHILDCLEITGDTEQDARNKVLAATLRAMLERAGCRLGAITEGLTKSASETRASTRGGQRNVSGLLSAPAYCIT